ncbi:MAG TPA: cellulase family glycosylhydrolase [Solirubrobacteraceae bacterium]|nr:cellulase family glycosylhydrolase [Solirubrobacteraceae bacterium]
MVELIGGARLARRVWRLSFLLGSLLCMVAIPSPPTALAAPPLAISVVGNHFVNGAGQTIRLLGVNREGTEYACVNGTGYSVGPEDAADAAAIASWHANADRIPINEDCWLGINGLPAYGTAGGYRQMIESYVSALNADGVYAILDLQWTAPGSLPADGLRTMPDDNSLAFWTSVASTFAGNPAVVFDAFNEPHSVSWSCWRNGGCTVPAAADGSTSGSTQTFTAVGMQAIVDAIRATGAHQPIVLAGLAHGNDLSGWLANEPTDPDHQLAASFHVYQPNNCATTSCWDSTVAPVAAVVPVTTFEFSESDCTEDFDNSLMEWADDHGIGYLGWGWFILTPHCQSLYLITDWNGTPAFPNGTALHDHLAALAAASSETATSSGGIATSSGGIATSIGGTASSDGAEAPGVGSVVVTPQACLPMALPALSSSVGGSACVKPKLQTRRIRLTRDALSVWLRSSQRATGEMTATTVRPFTETDAPHNARVRMTLGSKRFSLAAQTWQVISLRLPARARQMLAGARRVVAKVTITVMGTIGQTATLTRLIVAAPEHR